MPREVIASSSDPKDPYGQRNDGRMDYCWDVVCRKLKWQPRVLWYSSGRITRKVFYSVQNQSQRSVQASWLNAQISEFNFEYPEERKQSYEDFKFIRQLTDSIHECNGHYEMPLPFNYNDTVLPDNKDRRLSHLKRRLEQDNNYKSDYENFMRDVINRLLWEGFGWSWI